MPRLPYISQVSARTGRSDTPSLSNPFDASAMGADVGRALQGLGDAVGQGADVLANEIARQHKEEAANAVAGFDFTPTKLDLQTKAAADGQGYRQNVLNSFDQAVDSHASTLGSSTAAKQFKEAMRSQRLQLSEESAKWEFATREKYNKDQADYGLNTIQNKVATDPSAYDMGVQQMQDVIDARPGLTQLQRTAMKQEGAYDLSRRRFEGLLQNAKTPTELSAIEAELKSPAWADKMKPEDYYRTQERVDSAKKTLMGQAKSLAEAEVSSLKEMGRSTTIIAASDLNRARAAVRASGDFKLMSEMARLDRSEGIKSEIVKLPVAEQMRKAESAALAAKEGRGAAVLDVPADLAKTITNVSQGSGVSAGFIAALVKREYGAKLNGPNPDYGAPTSIVGPDGKPTSSAVGVGQFTNTTFLNLMRDPNVAATIGVNTSALTDAQLLDLRKNPEVSVAAIAALAVQNQKAMQQFLGRPVDDAETYMAHFLGASGAVSLIKAYQQTPDVPAASILPDAADANKPVFYSNGKALSVGDVYNNIAKDFTATPAKVAFEDQDTYKRIIDATEKAIKEDPMSHAQSVGLMSLPSLQDEGGFQAMGRAATQVADYYNIPRDKMKPFKQADADIINKKLEDGNSDQALQIMASVAQMGAAAPAAIRQLGEKDPLYGYAGALYLQTGPSVAGDIIRGHKLLKENPKLLETAGFKSETVIANFAAHTEGALNGIEPSMQKQIYEAALAYTAYQAGKGSASPKYDSEALNAAVDKVIGPIGRVNGVRTLIPLGLDEATVGNAVSNMKIRDWAHIADSAMPPRHRDGSLANDSELADEAVLQAIGANRYVVMDASGSPLTTGRKDASGRLENFTVTLEPDTIKRISSRGPSHLRFSERFGDSKYYPIGGQ